MFDDARSVWELIERRADASPDRVMLYDGDRDDDVRRVPGRSSSAPRPGCTALGVGAGRQRVVAAADVDRVGGARRRAVPARRGAEPDAADLPVPRGVVHREADRLQAADHAVDVEQLRLRRARRAGRGRDRRHAHARRRPLEPRRRSGVAAAAAPGTTIRPTIPVRWIFYTSGTTAEPKGARHTDRSVLAGAIGYAKKTHVVEDDIALVAFPFTHVGGIIIGVFTPLLTGSAAVLMEAWTPQASTELIAEARDHARQRRAGDPHRAARRGAREPGRVQDDPCLPVGRLGQAAAAPRRAHGRRCRRRVGITSGYGMTEAPIVVADRHRRARRRRSATAKARRRRASSSRSSTTASSS